MFRSNTAMVKESAQSDSAPVATPKTILECKLGQSRTLTAAERDALASIVQRTKAYAPGAVLLSDDASTKRPRFLLTGWACRQLILENGRRQIFGFLLPGDLLAPDCEGLMMGSVVALTAVTASEPCPTGDGSRDLQSVFAMASLALMQEREQLLRQQVLRLGSMNALQRLAHLLVELSGRLALVGLSGDGTIPFPLTQEILADALGMTPVHVNRTMKVLRSAKAVGAYTRHSLQIDTDKLASLLA